MEEALKGCSIFKLSGGAKELLGGEGIEARSAGEAYQQLSHLMERSGRTQHCTEVLEMAQAQLNDEKEYEPAPRDARRRMAAKLLQQMVTKRQMAAVKDQNGQRSPTANNTYEAANRRRGGAPLSQNSGKSPARTWWRQHWNGWTHSHTQDWMGYRPSCTRRSPKNSAHA